MTKLKQSAVKNIYEALKMLKNINPLASFSFTDVIYSWENKLNKSIHLPYITLVPIELVRLRLLQRERMGHNYFYTISENLKRCDDDQLMCYAKLILANCLSKSSHSKKKPASLSIQKEEIKSTVSTEIYISETKSIMLDDYIITGDNLAVWKRIT